MKQLKDIFASKATIWLFVELVVITVVAWAVFDPAVVNLYYRCRTLGFDTDKLLYAETTVGAWDEDASEEDRSDPYNPTEERRQQMLRQLTAVDGVASAYLYDEEYGSIGFTSHGYSPCRIDKDTLLLAAIRFVPDSRFFETYGLKPLPGSPSAEQLSHLQKRDRQAVLTRSGAMALFGSTDVLGRKITICYGDPDIVVTVVGVVEDFRKSMNNTLQSLIIRSDSLSKTECRYVIRLKEGMDAQRFVEEHGRELINNCQTGFNRISRLMTFEEHLEQQELDEGRTQEVNRSLALALFFLINLMLAVIGTVWLHAKRHTEECGVRRAFGATRWRVLWDFLWRNALLATAAVAVGLVIYLNYAYSGLTVEYGKEHCETLYMNNIIDVPTDKTWVDYFWPHFLVVSAVVYIIILCTVLIGTAIPAVKIIKTKITNALRDE